MTRIVEKSILGQYQGARITRFVITAEDVALKAKPGQFIMLMVKEEGERIPLTVVDTNKKDKTVTLIVQELGFSTKLLGSMNVGDSLYALVGPLGHATPIQNFGEVVLIGGGVGIAEIYPVAKALKEAGNRLITILGSRTKDLLILENELKAVSDEFYVTTDDGSHGRKGFTVDVLKEILESGRPLPKIVYAVGPIPMMRRVAETTKAANVKTLVSLNALMVDGTGMCGGCRVTIGSESKFTCVDGPEFDAHDVNWAELTKRNQVFVEQEKHICHLGRV